MNILNIFNYTENPLTTIKEYSEFLKSIGVVYSFKTKKEYQERVLLYKKVLDFTWRVDQKDIIDSFLKQEYKYYVINGIFGCGKTTLLLGLHIHSLLNNMYRPEDSCFISFNVCIKNELVQKLRNYGMKGKTKVRTFDSIVYEICKLYKYPYMELPNYDGKRKFAYKICKEIKEGEKELFEISLNPTYIYIDECQDLESQSFIIFETFFPNSQIIFAGDVFQSIQREPRESLLWSLLNNEIENISRHYMKETPRVPENILKNVKESLTSYYPEFSEEIDKWRSSNSHQQEIEWHRFYNYSDVFKSVDKFLEEHDPLNSMILTFSSAITVKGAIGDLARFRRYLYTKGQKVNNNHKKMDHDKLFLSTVNSSKGLERDYVFIVSTFPLERAFISFSNDLVINLITVGVTRAKKKVIFYVPAYEDKFSKTLENFVECPKPNKAKIREGTTIDNFKFSDYINMEHCTTELIRQNIIKYDTRIKLRESLKCFERSKLFEDFIPAPKLDTDEEKSFVGILIENLITSSWNMKWPNTVEIEELAKHPLYIHCFKKIKDKYLSYKKFISNGFNIKNHFMGIYYYSQIHLAVNNKIFIDLSESTRDLLKSYWNSLKDKVSQIKPIFYKIKIQSNMRMPWATGVCDVFISEKDEKDEKFENITIWEFKASVDQEWKDDASIQAIIYSLMSGKKWCKIVLMNPFRNEKYSYHFNMKNIMEMREMVINDIVTWNTNCFLSKNIKSSGKELKVTNQLILCMTKNQHVLYQFMSPSKLHLICNIFINKEKDKDQTKLEKLCSQSEIDEKTADQNIFNILNSAEYKDCIIYYTTDTNELKEEQRFVKIKDIIGDDDIQFVLDMLEYQPSEDLKYQPDFNDALIKSLVISSCIAKEYKLT
jgi:hypothetical protein